jgi:hypothetical protein
MKPTLSLAVNLTILLASFGSSLAYAQSNPYDLYVATTGSDSNQGTASAPLRTISKASQLVKAGGTVHVAPGQYEGGFKTSASGTASARIRYLSDVRWGAIIVPQSGTNNNSTAWTNSGSYVDIDGFDVNGTVDPGLKWRNGIYTTGSYTGIKNNHIHHVAEKAACTSQGGSAINTDYWNYGVNTEVIGNFVNHNGYPGCRFIQAIYISTSANVKNNLVFQNGGAGIHLWHDANHVNVINNTVFGNGVGIVVGGGDYYHTSGPADYVNVYNNIVMDNTYGIIENGATGTHNSYIDNLVYRNTTQWALLTSQHSGDINADPQFVNYIKTGGGNYRLKSTSPAVDRGTSSYAPADDFDGVKRPQGGTVDIGAYEFVVDPATSIVAADLYVATTGSDSNPGTAAAPLRTIVKAAQLVKAGGTVHVASGQYEGGFTTAASGTPSARIRYVSNARWGAVIVPPAGTANMNDTAWTNDGSYVDIEGFDVNGTMDPNFKWRSGIYTTGSYTAVKYNHIHHVGEKAACTGQGGAAINTDYYHYGVNTDVLGNFVNNNGYAGCKYIHGIYISTSANVKNNLIFNNGGAGIHMFHDANHVNAINNTIIGNDVAIVVGTGEAYHPTSGNDYTNVHNNIVMDNNFGIEEFEGTGYVIGTHNTYLNNLVYRNGTNWGLKKSTHSGTINADPQFINYIKAGGGDYRVRSTSPTIDHGAAIYAPSIDFDGVARPQGAAVDIGAYEFH